PDGSFLAVTSVTVDAGTNGTPRVATYTFTPPGGSWDGPDSGTYTVSIAANQVFDTDGPNAVAAGTLGTFAVLIPRTFTVNATNDQTTDTDGKLSLREALAKAN